MSEAGLFGVFVAGTNIGVFVVSVAPSYSVGALAAYSLARLRLPLRISAIIAAAFLVVRFYPKITVALPYYLLMRQWHLLDTRVAIILAHVSLTVPFVVWLMLGFFEEFPREIERSAMLDGCGPARRFFVLTSLPVPHQSWRRARRWTTAR